MGPGWNSYAPIAREGFKFIAIGLICSVVSWFAFDTWIIAILFLGLTCFVVFFFRNPGRLIPVDLDAIVSPADGKVMIAEALPTESDQPKQYKIAIFLSVFNVHINRAPFAAAVQKIIYRPGKFAMAFRVKESELNERNDIVFTDDYQRKITVTQIAGWVARRIVCYLKEFSHVNMGDRIGLIQFGSRVNLIIEGDIDPQIKVGDMVKGGSTVLAQFVNQSSVKLSKQKVESL
jgi:phosphatidylserine decarboxylase